VINWDATPGEHRLIFAIANRVESLDFEYPDSTQELVMDLTACHLNGCPLDLNGLLNASLGDLMHDALGIRQHLDRTTGKLGGCFLPRYALANHSPEVR
jgi:hypothetical protein